MENSYDSSDFELSIFDTSRHSEGHDNKSLDLAYFQRTTGTIKGVVIDAQDRPISNASVSSYRHTNQPVSRNDRADILADQEGRFVFSGVAPGTYTVVAFKEPQYPDSSFFGISEAYAKGAQRIITIEEGQTVNGVVLKLDPKHSLLKIFVKDEKGDGFGAGFTFTIRAHSVLLGPGAALTERVRDGCRRIYRLN